MPNNEIYNKNMKDKLFIGKILDNNRIILDKKKISKTFYKFLIKCQDCGDIGWKNKNWIKTCLICQGRRQYNYGEERVIRRSYTNYRSRAKSKNLEFLLTFDDFKNIVFSACHWCGSASTGIDRLNNTLGYIIENSLPACKECNYAKNDMTVDEWNSWINRITKFKIHSKA